jgi:anti-sigma B factor antagonist
VNTGIETATVALVAPRGELDLFAAAELDDALRRVADTAVVVVLDLRGLTFCDTAGVHIVDQANTAARARHRRLVVVPPAHTACAVFELTGANDRLDFAFDSDPVGPGLSGTDRSGLTDR